MHLSIECDGWPTIEFCSGDTISRCWKVTEFGNEIYDTHLAGKKEANLVRGAWTLMQKVLKSQ